MGARSPDVPTGWTALPLDLTRLVSVHDFVAALPEGPIDRLIFNAGSQMPNADAQTPNSLETTFATKHLAHYLLLRRLLPRLALSARIILTWSGTHDPAESKGVPPPRHATADLLAHPDCDAARDSRALVEGMRAYSASNLCNVMTVRSLAASLEAAAGGRQIFAYDPGLTPGTELVRSQPWLMRALIWPLLPLITPFVSGMNRLTHAGCGLADLATDTEAPPGRVYASLRQAKLTWPAPSALARDDGAARAVWANSAQLDVL